MDVRELLEQVKSGGVNIEEAEKQLKNLGEALAELGAQA